MANTYPHPCVAGGHHELKIKGRQPRLFFMIGLGPNSELLRK